MDPKNVVRKAAIVGFTALAVWAADTNIDLYDRKIPVDVSGRKLQVPVYNSFTGLRPLRCSAYVRKAAEELFGKHYSFSNAWDRRYEDKLVHKIEGKSLDELVDEGILEPGMIVGMQSPEDLFSYFYERPENDKEGNPLEYSHVVLYLGQGLFAHQYKAKTLVQTWPEMRSMGLDPREILDSVE